MHKTYVDGRLYKMKDFIFMEDFIFIIMEDFIFHIDRLQPPYLR